MCDHQFKILSDDEDICVLCGYRRIYFPPRLMDEIKAFPEGAE